MKCSDLQFILPVYSDSALTEKEQLLADIHLDTCPVCRQELADLNEMRNELRSIRKLAISASGLEDLRSVVGERIEATSRQPMFQLVGDRRRWVDVWLMPFAVGSFSTLMIGFSLLWLIVSNEIRPLDGRSESGASVSNTTFLYPYPGPSTPVETAITPLEYAMSRSLYSHESPSINPSGPLVALSEDLVNESDDEVTVVADVYGNGSATIAEVVEAPSDVKAVDRLEKALRAPAGDAAFVPASFDHRSEAMRVVLKIQSVSVNTDLR